MWDPNGEARQKRRSSSHTPQRSSPAPQALHVRSRAALQSLRKETNAKEWLEHELGTRVGIEAREKTNPWERPFNNRRERRTSGGAEFL